MALRKYPGVAVDGLYTGKLNNSGETLTLVSRVGAIICLVCLWQQRSVAGNTARSGIFACARRSSAWC